MATLSLQTPSETGGITPVAADAGGDVFANTGKMYLLVHNGDASGITVTATAQNTSTSTADYGPLTKANAVTSVGAGATELIGPFPQTAFNNGSDQVAIGYSAVTSVTVAAIQIQ